MRHGQRLVYFAVEFSVPDGGLLSLADLAQWLLDSPDRIKGRPLGSLGMDIRLLMAGSLCLAGLAGCTAVAESVDAMTAGEALAAARDLIPDGELVAIDGVEGAQPARAVADVPLDDGLSDGDLGDGRLSSWVVTFANQGSLTEVRVHADGREALRASKALPAGFAQEAGKTDDSGRSIDSSEAAAIAAAVPEFKQHAADYANAGYTYSYVPYGRQYPIRDWSTGLFQSYAQMQVIGWGVYGNQWSVVHYDPDAWSGDVAPTTAFVSIDAATGKVQELTVSVPRTLQAVFEEGTDFQDPVPPTGLDPYVHRYEFEIPRGTASIAGILIAYSTGLGLANLVPDPPIFRIVSTGGEVAFTSSGEFGFDEIQIDAPMSGTWAIELTHATPIPGSYHLGGFLYAAVPLNP